MTPIPPVPPVAGWVRVHLLTPADAPSRPGAPEGELVLRADRVSVGEDSLDFMVGDEVVFRLDRRYYGSLTWFVDRPTFGEWLATHQRRYAKANKPWTAAELADLDSEVADGVAWDEIADRHERTPRAVESAHYRRHRRV